jgi:anti-sigma factor RsiW
MMTMSRNHPTDHDLELLSAYLDGELPDRERAALEKRLATEPVLRAALQGLRETIVLVHDLPRHKAPRNFTLDPALYGRTAWWRRVFTGATVLQLSGALGTAASVVIIALALLTTGGSPQDLETQTALQKSEESPTVEIALQPTLIPSLTVSPTLSGTATLVAGEALQAEEAPAPEVPDSSADAQEAAASEAENLMQPQAAALPTATLRQIPATAENDETAAGDAAFAAPPEGAAAAAPGEGAVAPGVGRDQSTTTPALPSITPTVHPAELTYDSVPPPTVSLTPAEVGQILAQPATPPTARAEPAAEEEPQPRWWLVGLGAVGLVFSGLLFFIGWRKAR